MQSARWYVNRLLRMSAMEIGHRIGKNARTSLERIGIIGARKPPPPVVSPDCSRSFIFVPDIATEAYIEAANRLLAGELNVFALTHSENSRQIEWNKDVQSGTVAPLSFGKSMDYRDDRLVGNIKYVWEPNRHLELVTLAQAFALSKNRSYLECIATRLDTWFNQCPYPYGVNWSSSLELGIRLINWSLAWQLVGKLDAEIFDGEKGSNLRARWLDNVYQHTHFIRHYYSRHSSANNHLIGEAAGVFIAACTWPYWKDLAKWGEEARLILIDEAEKQTHSDGVNREQAISYQQFVLDFFVLTALAGRANDMVFPAKYWNNIELMTEFVFFVMDVGGNVPMIGDADDGYVVRLSQEPGFCPYRSLLATGAVLFDRPDFASKSEHLDDKTRFLLGNNCKFLSLIRGNGQSNPVARTFPEGGYFVFGYDLDSDQEIRLIADAGPLGYSSIAAHGHADALAFVLSVAGREILVDSGTYSYHTKPIWRTYFRGTGAHNTVRVDGEDQSVQGGDFMWLHHANARCLEFESNEAGSRFLSDHDGYARLPDPVIHCREIRQHRNIIYVTDRLTCNKKHIVEQFWHFSEKCDVNVDGSTVTARNGSVTIIMRPERLVDEVRHSKGSDNPPEGWISRRFDVKVPADSVCFVLEIDGDTELGTIIECKIEGRDDDLCNTVG